MSTANVQADVRIWAVLAVVLLFAVCQAVEVTNVRGLRGDETYYINAACTMMESGDWLTPRYESGRLRFQKPILTYWLVGTSMRLFGVGLASGRLPSLLLSLATLPFVYGLGRVLLRDRTAALFAVVVHASISSVYSNAHQARTDAVLAFFAIAAMYFFARLIFQPGHERRTAMLAYAATAGAILTKGLAGFGFILLPVAVFLVLSWRQVGATRWRAAASPWGLAVMALLTAPWFGPMLARHGAAFVNTFLGDQVGTRVSGEEGYFFRNIIEYIWLFFRGTVPWNVFLILAMPTVGARLGAELRAHRVEWKFLLTWFVVVMLIFLAANIARGRYLLPVMPVFSLLAGLVLAQLAADTGPKRGPKWALRLFAVAILSMGIACLVQFAAMAVLGVGAGPARLAVGVALVAGAVVLFLMTCRPSLRGAVPCAAGLMLLCMMCGNTFLLAPEPTETAAELGRSVLSRQPEDVQMAAVGLKKHTRAAASLYSGRRFADWTESRDPAEQAKFLEHFLATPGPKLVVLDEKVYRALPQELLQRLRLIDSRSTFRSIIETWFFERPQDLRARLRENKFTIYALCPEPDNRPGPPQGQTP